MLLSLRNIFILFILLATFSGAYGKLEKRQVANTPGETEQDFVLKEHFLKVTGIRLGEYTLKEGPARCQVGELRVVNLKTELSLMLGAHALIIGIGRDQFKELERQCETEYWTSFKKGFVEGRKKQTCKFKEKTLNTTYHVKVEYGEGILKYTRTLFKSDQSKEVTNCTLRRVE